MFTFYIKEAFRILTRSPFAAIVIISITTIAVMMSSFSLMIILLSNDLSQKIKKNIELTAYIDDFIDSSKIILIKEKLQNLPNVSSVKFIDKNDALKEFIKETGEDFRNVLTENPLPQSFVIKFNPEKITYENIHYEVKRIKEIAGISDVVYDDEVVMKVLRYLKSGQLIVYIFSVMLIFLSIYLVYTNSRIQIEANNNLYQTMKLVGAKLITIKIPIIIYGILVGIISGILCIGVNFLLFRLLITISNNLKLSMVIKGSNTISLITGIVLGFIGSYLSSKRITLQSRFTSQIMQR